MIRALAIYSYMIAVNRVILATLFFFIVFANQGFPYQDIMRSMAIAYAALAIIYLIVCVFFWYFEYRLSFYLLIIDIVAFFSSLMIAILHGDILYFFVLLLLANICIVASERWNFVRGIPLVLGLLISAVFIFATFDIVAGEFFGLEITPLLSMFFVAIVSAWFGANNPTIRLPHFLPRGFDPGPSLKGSTLAYAKSNVGCDVATLCWLSPDDDPVQALRLDSQDEIEELAATRFSSPRALKALKPMLFDVRNNWALELGLRDQIIYARLSDTMRSFLDDLECPKGIAMPLDPDGTSKAALIVSGLHATNWRGLKLMRQVCEEIDHGALWHRSAMRERSDALGLLRKAVAADLHDSVAHSLAGARFMLAALRTNSRPPVGSGAEIESIESALTAEQLHVRSLITQLRAENSETAEVNLIADLRTDCRQHELRWNAVIAFEESDFQIMVPMWFSLQIQQVVREAISNGARHARARKFKIRCQKKSSHLLLRIANDLPLDKMLHGPFKPRSIVERTQELGGTAQIASGPNVLAVSLKIPLAEAAENGMPQAIR